MKYHSIILTSVLSVLVFTGCGQKTAFSKLPEQKADSPTSPEPGPSPAPGVVDPGDGVAACEIDIPQVRLDGNVNSFEAAGGFGVMVGYNPAGGHGSFSGANANLKMNWVEMDMSMLATDPMNSAPIADADVTANQTHTNLGVEVDFSQIKVNPDFYFKTPLADVSRESLKKGLAKIKKQTDKIPWVGRVLKFTRTDDLILLNAGSLAGVQIGDEFTVYNVRHQWDGTPCASTYRGSYRVPGEGGVQVSVMSVDSMTSFAHILNGAGLDLRRGAEVEALNLVGDTKKNPRYLKKKMVKGKITSKSFPIPGGGTFDFEAAINAQATGVIRDNGFVLAQ